MDSGAYLFIPIFLFTAFSAFCSASETVFFSLPRSWVKGCETSPTDRFRLIAKLLRSPQELLVTIFILNTIANILVQNSISAYVGEEGSFWAKILIPFFLLLFFGEIFPKQLGMVKNRMFAPIMAPTLDRLNRWIAPVREGVLKVTLPLSRILFSFLKKDRILGSEEMEHVLSSSQEKGVIYPEEVELASGYLDLKDSDVREVLLPKEEMDGYDITDPLTKLTHLFIEKNLSEVPVYQKTWDHLLGTINLSSFLLIRDRLKVGRDLQPHLFKPLFFPEVAPARVLLDTLLKKGRRIGFAVDEFGGLAGMVERDDLLEVVLGSLGSSTPEEKDYQILSPGVIIAEGTMDLEELEEFFKVPLREEAVSQTVGGWLIEKIGDIPKVGTLYEKRGLEFQVVSAEPHRVKKVLIRMKGLK